MNKRVGNTRFVHYFNPVLDALRALGGTGRPRDVYKWIQDNLEIPQEEIEFLHIKSGQSKFENKVAWARFYLVKAGLVDNSTHGIWTLTPKGKDTHMDYPEAYALFREIQASFHDNKGEEEIESTPAPADKIEAAESNIVYRTDVPPLPDRPLYWFGGASWNSEDQTERFIKEGVWQNGWDDQYFDDVKKMRVGEKIAIKSAFTQKNNLPFNINGAVVSVMRIKATGTILENPGDGKSVRVAWDPVQEPRDWYFYTHQGTLWGVDPSDDLQLRLIAFTFKGREQNYSFWLNQPYWANKYKFGTASFEDEVLNSFSSENNESEPSYTVDSIIEEGSFLGSENLSIILQRLRAKNNIILQGAPGTGKTWLAKRLGYALLGHKKADDRIRVVQFHPSLSYEDFVRGWRPSADSKLSLTNGIFLEAIEAAISNPEPFVIVIEEINRGNPATIFGELLTLLESDKRTPSEAISLAYTHSNNRAERIYIPDNLYVIGTMNISDRSLAMVDLALRRRFSFVTLEPTFNGAWEKWCVQQGGMKDAFVQDIKNRIEVVNNAIASKLGNHFKIGHSYFTPKYAQTIRDEKEWFKSIVDTEIYPLLDEYFYDDDAEATELRRHLLTGI